MLEFEDIRYQTVDAGSIAKITINRPEVRNAFRPKTVMERLKAFDLAHEDPKVGAIILTGEGDLAFYSGSDQKVRSHARLRRQGWDSTASSATAKTQQARVLCLTHNLMTLMEEEIRKRSGVINEAEHKC